MNQVPKASRLVGGAPDGVWGFKASRLVGGAPDGVWGSWVENLLLIPALKMVITKDYKKSWLISMSCYTCSTHVHYTYDAMLLNFKSVFYPLTSSLPSSF